MGVKNSLDSSIARKEDDLTRIAGIGPKIAQVLSQAGIKSFQQLAEQDQPTLEALVTSDGIAFRETVAETWPEQAQLAAQGDWEGLRKLQDQLKGNAS